MIVVISSTKPESSIGYVCIASFSSLPQLIKCFEIVDFFEAMKQIGPDECQHQRKDECRAYRLMMIVERLINSLV